MKREIKNSVIVFSHGRKYIHVIGSIITEHKPFKKLHFGHNELSTGYIWFPVSAKRGQKCWNLGSNVSFKLDKSSSEFHFN